MLNILNDITCDVVASVILVQLINFLVQKVETTSFKTRISHKYISGKIIELPLLGYNKNIRMIYAMLCYISHSKENFNGV